MAEGGVSPRGHIAPTSLGQGDCLQAPSMRADRVKGVGSPPCSWQSCPPALLLPCAYGGGDPALPTGVAGAPIGTLHPQPPGRVPRIPLHMFRLQRADVLKPVSQDTSVSFPVKEQKLTWGCLGRWRRRRPKACGFLRGDLLVTRFVCAEAGLLTLGW